MKTVTFQGIDYEVPDWVRWIAQDGDGHIFAYDVEPLVYEGCHGVGFDAVHDALWIGGPSAPMVLMEVP